MKYIRFLKTPRIEKHNVNALITITSDLGDFTFAEEVQLYACLYSSSDLRPLAAKNLTWSPYSQGLRLCLDVADVKRAAWPARLYVGTSARSDGDSLLEIAYGSHNGVMSAWSSVLDPRSSPVAERLVERQLSTGKGMMRIWEETGESIARHVWDAGVALAAHIQAVCTNGREAGLTQLDRIFAEARDRPLTVIELGSGTGLVGLSITQSYSSSTVLLTDLEDAEEIIEKNMMVNTDSDTSLGSVSFMRLDWEEELPDACRSARFDLVLFADCTYNADSNPSLVRTVERLLGGSPEAVIVAAMKVRHESESEFFKLMRESGLIQKSHQTLILSPAVGEEKIEVFTFCKQPRR